MLNETYICIINETAKAVLERMMHKNIDAMFVVDVNNLLVGKVEKHTLQNKILENDGTEMTLDLILKKDVPFLIDTEIEDESELQNKIKYLQNKYGLSLHEPIPVCNSGLRPLYFSELAVLLRAKEERGDQLTFSDGGSSVKNVCIIGGGGYLGTVLAEKLLNQGYGVIIFDKFIFGTEPIVRLKNSLTKSTIGRLEIYAGDMRSIPDLMKILKDVDAVILLGAIVGDPASGKYPVSTFEVNYLSVQLIAEICAYLNIRRLLYASTCSVYGQSDSGAPADENSPLNPLSHYARAKIKAEEAILKVKSPNFAPTILRMSTLYGPSFRMRYDLVVNTMMMKGIIAGKITIFGGQQWRPLLSVDDAAEAYMLVLQSDINKIKRKIYNVGEERENYQIKDIGQMVSQFLENHDLTVEVETIANSEDLRDYQVSFKKIKDDLHYQTKYTVDSTLEKLYQVIIGQLKENIISNSAFYNDRNNYDSDAQGKFIIL